MSLDERDYMRGEMRFLRKKSVWDRHETLLVIGIALVAVSAISWVLVRSSAQCRSIAVQAPAPSASKPSRLVQCEINGKIYHVDSRAECDRAASASANGQRSPSATPGPEFTLPAPRQEMRPAPPAAVEQSSAATTIYLCKSYDGGMFWSSGICHQHRALIERIASVPTGVPFSQQVQIAQGSIPRPESQPPAQSMAAPQETSQPAECKRLEEYIARLDALARQPLSGQAQDEIRDKRKRARDRQFAIRC